MAELKSEFLFEMTVELGGMQELGQTPFGTRRIAVVAGGAFEGPRLRGKLVPGAVGDWLLARADGALQLDVRATLEAEDGALIYMTYRGIRHGPAEVLERLARGEAVDPSEYYFRIAPFFETGDERYAWLNRIVAVGVGERRPEGPIYRIYEIL